MLWPMGRYYDVFYFFSPGHIFGCLFDLRVRSIVEPLRVRSIPGSYHHYHTKVSEFWYWLFKRSVR